MKVSKHIQGFQKFHQEKGARKSQANQKVKQHPLYDCHHLFTVCRMLPSPSCDASLTMWSSGLMPIVFRPQHSRGCGGSGFAIEMSSMRIKNHSCEE